jgi:site-specific DNA recombinase
MYYRCSSRNISGAECGQSEAIRAKHLEEAIEEAFLRAVGHAQIIRRTFRPGVDRTKDVAEVTRALAELREDREAGLYSSELGKKEYREEYLRLEAKREALASMPVVPDEWKETPTGQTYADRWAELSSPTEKNKELREAGVRAIVHREELPKELPLMELGEAKGTVRHTLGRVELLLPRDLYDRVRGLAAEHIA